MKIQHSIDMPRIDVLFYCNSPLEASIGHDSKIGLSMVLVFRVAYSFKPFFQIKRR